MNLFEIVKYGVSCREAAELYGVEVNRYGMALLPVSQRPTSQFVCGRRPLLLLRLRGTRRCDRLCRQAVSAFAL